MSVGGYDVECVDEISKDFYCIICLKLMRNAIQMNCGHGMCRTCFDEMINSYQQRNIAPECPSCRSNTSAQQVMEVSMIDRVISSLKVMCQAHADGCEWVGELSNMQAHNLECNYRNVTCPIPGCNEIIQYCQITKHIQETCDYFDHDCSFKEFGCTEKINVTFHKKKGTSQDVDVKSQINIDNKCVHEGDANHLALFRQLLTEKETEIEKLKKENETLKEKLVSFEDMKSKMDDMYALLKCKLDSSNGIAVTTQTLKPECLSSLTLNDSNNIIDKITNKYDLVEDLNNEKSIYDSIGKHWFLKLPLHGNKLNLRENLVDSLYETLKEQIALLDKDCQNDVFFLRIIKLCDAVKFSQVLNENEWEDYFKKYCELQSCVFNAKIQVIKTFYQQIMFLKDKRTVSYDAVWQYVFKIKKFCYVTVYNLTNSFFVIKGLKNDLYFYKNHVEFHVYSIKEIMICNPDNCIELEETNLSYEMFDEKKKMKKCIFITQRMFGHGDTSGFYEHEDIYLRVLLE